MSLKSLMKKITSGSSRKKDDKTKDTGELLITKSSTNQQREELKNFTIPKRFVGGNATKKSPRQLREMMGVQDKRGDLAGSPQRSMHIPLSSSFKTPASPSQSKTPAPWNPALPHQNPQSEYPYPPQSHTSFFARTDHRVCPGV